MKLKVKEKLSAIFQDKFTGFIYIAIAISILLILLSVLLRYLDNEEFRQLHSAWYTAHGYAPYSDFFQTHHPLLWVLLAPLFFIFGDSIIVIFIARFIMVFFTFACIYLVFRIAEMVIRSKEVALLSALLLLSSVTFIQCGVEVRSDVPQVFTGMLSFYFLLLFFRRGRIKHIVLSGIFTGISFLFLQTTIFLLFAYIPVFAYKFYKGELYLKNKENISPGKDEKKEGKGQQWKTIGLFFLSFFLPLTGLIVYLIVTNSFSEYILTNWLVPLGLLDSYPSYHTLLGLIIENLLFWYFLLSGSVVFFIWKRKKGGRELRLLTFITLLMLLFPTLFVRLPDKQIYMFSIAFGAIPAAYFFKAICFNYNFRLRGKVTLLAAAVLLPFFILMTMITVSNKYQLDTVRFVMQNSTVSDTVYDGSNQFNLFRKDLHYFWYGFSHKREFATYNKITGNKNSADYDIYELIHEKKPKFISTSKLKAERRGLSRIYNKTEFKGLYIRRE